MWLERDESVRSKYPNWREKTRIKILYNGRASDLPYVHHILLHFPGGGFVAMQPENHEEVTRRWAKQLGKKVVIVSVDYGKAPEFPYPYALDECFDIYRRICETNGHCVGVNTASAQRAPGLGATESEKYYRRVRISLAGDSAGGNISIGVTSRIILQLRERRNSSPGVRVPLTLQVTSMQSPRPDEELPNLWMPEGLLLIYAALNFDMASWIAPSDSHAPLLRPGSETSLTALMKNYKGKKYHETRLTRGDSNEAVDANGQPSQQDGDTSTRIEQFPGLNIPYLSFTSRMSYFDDRIITPELQRAMALWYLGENSTRNPATDIFLSPVNTPEDILAEFPKIWMMCGECDPFVDDTVIFAARVRHAIRRKMERQQQGHDTDVESDTTHGSGGLHDHGWSTQASPVHENHKEFEADEIPIDAMEATQDGWRAWARGVVKRFKTSFLAGRYSEVEDLAELEKKQQEEQDDESTMSSSDYDAEEDDYGEVSRDPMDHVTVKIYAGLSHAYLQLVLMLPEASHAISLCGEWLIEMFESSEETRRRRRIRRIQRKQRVYTAPEFRDEDNIPSTIDLPFGAEYRLGGGQIRLKPDQEQPKKKKYFVGDSDESESDDGQAGFGVAVPPEVDIEVKGLEIVDLDSGSGQGVLQDAKRFTQTHILRGLDSSNTRNTTDQSLIYPRTLVSAAGKKSSSLPRKLKKRKSRSSKSGASNAATTPSSKTNGSLNAGVTTSASTNAASKSNVHQQQQQKEMFLSEFDIVDKRRNVLQRDVYSGVGDEEEVKELPRADMPDAS